MERSAEAERDLASRVGDERAGHREVPRSKETKEVDITRADVADGGREFSPRS